MTTATTILEQIGGNTFVTMTGAYNIVDTHNGLKFQFKGCKMANMCWIQLNEDDTYTMTFYKLRGINCDETHEESGLFFIQLVERFEEYAGLYASI